MWNTILFGLSAEDNTELITIRKSLNDCSSTDKAILIGLIAVLIVDFEFTGSGACETAVCASKRDAPSKNNSSKQ
jgi:hypothetical protein